MSGDDRIIADWTAGTSSRGRAATTSPSVAGPDSLYGGTGTDHLFGSGGRDILSAGAGADRLHGGPGNDRLAPAGGRDRLRAGAGDDRVYYSRDGRKDVVRCGPGEDTVLATSAEGAPLEDSDFDQQDVFVGCERFRLSL